MKTDGYGGKRVRKRIRIVSDDPKNESLSLFLAGQVIKTVDILPKITILSGFVGDDISGLVRLTPIEGYEFKITGTKMDRAEHVRVTVEEPEGPGYQVRIQNLANQPGRYTDRVFLLTDSELLPEIELKVYGHLQHKAKEKSAGS